jgi:hypothetical protein
MTAAASRTWLIRVGTVAGLGALALAAYNLLRTHQLRCGSHRGACDLPPPTHPHLQLALLLAIGGVLILSGTVLIARLWHPPVVWEQRPPAGGSVE